jgi:HEXXH motif-containing protein
MTIDFSFAPDARRADAMNQRVYRELSASLRHILDVVDDRVIIDRPRISEVADQLDDGVAFQPMAFASYFAAVRALLAEDYLNASHWFSTLAAVPQLPDRVVVALGDELGTATSNLYAHMVEEDEPSRLALTGPSAKAGAEFRALLADAIGLIELAAPELAGEIAGLARQIVLVSQSSDRESVFDGGSHYQLWNALFLNLDLQRTRVGLAEVVAHECAHSLLFGYTIDEPLTCNGDAALYSSPLRHDKRPMDGIYHATFVSARMAWLLEQLIASGQLDAAEREEAEIALARDCVNFEEGNSIILEHGLLSTTGLQVLAGARDFMAGRQQRHRGLMTAHNRA